MQQLVDALRLGHVDRWPDDLPHVDRAVTLLLAQVRQQVLGVEDADDVVEVLLEDRQARMAGPHDHVEHLLEGIVDIHRADADARHHHLVDALLGELDDPVDHLLLVFLDPALL